MPCKEAVEAAEAATEYCREHVGWIETKVLAALIQSAMAPAEAKAIEAAYREGAASGLGFREDSENTDYFWLHSAARKAMGIGDSDG